MPGFILHLTAGKMLLDDIKENTILKEDEDKIMFMTGCIIPDVAIRKRKSHFRNTQQQGRIMQIPDLDLFNKKYGDRVDEPIFLGYLFHLYIDRRFFEEYIPKAVKIIDDEGNETGYIKTGKKVYIKKTGKLVDVDEYRSEKYYYGDYTRMNTYLINKYNISLDMFDNIKIPYIEEVNMDGYDDFVSKMKGYLDVPEEAVNNLEVFDIDDVLKCIKEWTDDFVRDYL